MPDRFRSRAQHAATAAFLVAALVVGFVLGSRSQQVTDDDLEVGRRQAFDRQQCFVDYLSLDPATRLELVGGDSHLAVLCPRLQEMLRPGDRTPDVGDPDG